MTNSSHVFDWLWQLLTKSIPPLLPHSIYLVILCNNIMFGIIAAHKMIQCKNMWWCDILTYYSAFTVEAAQFECIYIYTRSLGALRAPTSNLWPFGPALGPSGLLDTLSEC